MLSRSEPGVCQPLLAEVHERERVQDVRLSAAIAKRSETCHGFGQGEPSTHPTSDLVGTTSLRVDLPTKSPT